MEKILIIEDDPAIMKGLKEFIKNEGYVVMSSTNGAKGYDLALKEPIDLIILDIMLPGMDGIEICKQLRKNNSNVLILILTSKKHESDKVLGLEFGADDYVTKPFSLRELSARIKALLRRKNSSGNSKEVVSFDNLKIYFKKQEIYKNDILQKVSAKEFEILVYFLNHDGEVISRNDLLDKVWGYDVFPTTRTVDNYILSLRKIIEDNPSEPKHLLTIPTVGYKFKL